MNRLTETLLYAVVGLLVFCAVLMTYWLAMPWPSITGLVVLSAIQFALSIPKSRWISERRGVLSAAWMASLAIPVGLWFESHRSHVPDLSYALFAWMIAAAVFTMTFRLTDKASKTRWRVLGMSWAFAGAAIWLAASYLQNNRLAFYLAVIVTLVLLAFCKLLFRLPFACVLGANTLLLLFIVIPLADLFVRPDYQLDARPDSTRKLYSYEVARKDPAAFAAWWNFYVKQYHKMMAELGSSGHRPKHGIVATDSQATFFESQIHINSEGFRGPDFPKAKAGAYRIVAIGESTTFGMTLNVDDKPWPEVLEQMIRERLKPDRPVEVINAGLPALTLPANLDRFPDEILPLKPDMVISYHGFNGFSLLNSAMPETYGHLQPAYKKRPLKLLADAEFRLKMGLFKRSLVPKIPVYRLGVPDPLETDYAKAYRQLIQTAATNHFRLVLANFSMAVNDRSDPDVIAFYRAGFPSVHWQIQANILHSSIVKQLAAQYPGTLWVDTHPGLDGVHQKFIDLVHFTQEGRQQLAENIFTGIEDVLEHDLHEPTTNAP